MNTSTNGLGFDFCAFLDYDKSPEVCLFEIGNYKCEPGYSFGPVIRPRGILHYVLSGKGRLVIMNKEYHIHGGQFFYIPAGISAFYEADRQDPWEYRWAHIGGTALHEVLSDCRIDEYHPVKDIPSPSWTNGKRFDEIINDILVAYDREYYCISRMYELMDFLMNAYGQKSENTSESLQLKYVRTVIKYIQLKYSEAVHVETIAQTCGLNRSYLSRLFRDATGSTIKDYLQTYRMNAAENMLRSTGNSIQYISSAVGYSDIFTFSKAFKKHTGMSPSAYREARRL